MSLVFSYSPLQSKIKPNCVEIYIVVLKVKLGRTLRLTSKCNQSINFFLVSHEHLWCSLGYVIFR